MKVESWIPQGCIDLTAYLVRKFYDIEFAIRRFFR